MVDILDKALRSYDMVLTRADLCSRVNKLGNTGDKGPSHSRTLQKTPSLNHVSNQKWKLHLKKVGSHSWKSSYWKIRDGTTCSGQT